MAVVFFSYSHRDEAVRDLLETHCAMAKRDGLIQTWHDRRISPGDNFEGQISENLEQADIVLLLVSPYFLASSYCYDIEMTRAMERQQNGDATVIPVIAEPCDWHSAPFGKLQAVPKDGKPISKFPNINDAMVEVVHGIRNVLTVKGETLQPRALAPTHSQHTIIARPRSSNLHVKKQFTELDKDRFRDDTFRYICSFFEESLTELKKRNDSIDIDFLRVDAHTFTATIYAKGKKQSECSISLAGQLGREAIVYSPDKSSRGNSYTGIIRIADDGTVLGWTTSPQMYGRAQSTFLSKQGAAENFWSIFIEPLQ